MTDDRDKRRARTHAGDDERANIGKRHRTAPHGVPVEVDPELTPAPQLPPVPSMGDWGARLERLEVGTERLIEGLGRVWLAIAAYSYQT